jgi:hypothetical protein
MSTKHKMVVDIEETALASRHRRLEVEDDGWRRRKVMMLLCRVCAI